MREYIYPPTVFLNIEGMASVVLLVELSLIVNYGSSVAPGDEHQSACETLRAIGGAAPTPDYSANMRVLMDSWNYQSLLPPRLGAVWDQMDNDMNNFPEVTTNVSFIRLPSRYLPLLPCMTIYGYAYSGFSSPTLHANKKCKCVDSVLVHRITG